MNRQHSPCFRSLVFSGQLISFSRVYVIHHMASNQFVPQPGKKTMIYFDESSREFLFHQLNRVTFNISLSYVSYIYLCHKSESMYPTIGSGYHRFGDDVPGHTTRAPPYARGGRVQTDDQTIASPMP